MTSTITSKTDHSRLAYVDQFLRSKGVITTGVHGSEGAQTHRQGPSIAQIAEWAEFGLGQPQRSWLRAWFDENKSQIESMLQRQLAQAFKESQSFEWAAERFALWVQASIQRRIRNQIAPPNAASTIRKKKSSVPLIDTGLFRSAIVSCLNGSAVAAPVAAVRGAAAKKTRKPAAKPAAGRRQAKAPKQQTTKNRLRIASAETRARVAASIRKGSK